MRRSSRRPTCSTTPPATAAPNDLHTWLLDADDEERRRRARRLTDALVSFDAATIATIHQFCQLVLRSLGVAGDTDASATLVEDLDQLTTEVVDDLYLARFAGHRTPPWSRDVAPADRPRGRRRPTSRRRAPAGARRGARLRGGGTGAVRPRRARRDRHPQAAPGRAELRRPAGAARRCAGRRGRPGPRADAAPLEGRADRRVPGHRPGAVAGLRPGVHRARRPWCSSATPSRPSTPSAAATS